MAKQNSLYEEIKRFQSEKKIYFVILILVGLLGLVFPVIPGLLLIGLGIALISPKHGTELMEKIKNRFKSIISGF